jgi:hypothetical protein
VDRESTKGGAKVADESGVKVKEVSEGPNGSFCVTFICGGKDVNFGIPRYRLMYSKCLELANEAVVHLPNWPVGKKPETYYSSAEHICLKPV